MKKKIKIGIIGYASIAKRLMIPAILESNELFELVAIGSRDVEKTKNNFHDERIYISTYEEIIADSNIEALYIPLPTGLHEEWAIKALENKKHLLVEKSLGVSYDSVKRILDCATKNKCIIMENFMFTFHSQHEWVKRKIHDNTIGEIRLFRSQFGFPPLAKDNFRYNKKLGGGALLDAGAYTIKASQFFFGNSLEVATAALYIDKETNVDLYGNITLVSSDGIACQLSFGFDNYYQCNYEFWGSDGVLTAKKSFTPKPLEKPIVLLEKNGELKVNELDADNHFIKILASFHQKIITLDIETCLAETLCQSRILQDVMDKAMKFYI